MERSIAARYAARQTARFVSPSAKARERRLGLRGAGSFRPASARLTEETGLERRTTGVLGSIGYGFVERGTRSHKAVDYCLMEPVGGDLERHDHEFDRVRWVRFDEAPGLLTFETERALVARAAEI